MGYRLKKAPFFELFFEDEEFLEKKFELHRKFSAWLYVVGGLLGLFFWSWDYITDPTGARETWVLRLVFLSLLMAPYFFDRIRNRRHLTLLMIFLVLMTEVVFVFIIDRLDGGMQYGLAGFMFYMMVPSLAFLAFSFLSGIVYILLAAVLPHIVAALGFVEGFDQAQYAILIWPAALVAMLVEYAYVREYHRRSDLEERLDRLSRTDGLTGLFNRRHFFPKLREEIERSRRSGRPLAMVMMDIDRFKTINDRFGHTVGDMALKLFAELLRAHSRLNDTPARIGGEEFVLLLPETDRVAAEAVAQRILQAAAAIRIPVPDAHGVTVGFTLSAGVAQWREEEDETAFLNAVDQALYAAKRAGRNRVVCRTTS